MKVLVQLLYKLITWTVGASCDSTSLCFALQQSSLSDGAVDSAESAPLCVAMVVVCLSCYVVCQAVWAEGAFIRSWSEQPHPLPGSTWWEYPSIHFIFSSAPFIEALSSNLLFRAEKCV